MEGQLGNEEGAIDQDEWDTVASAVAAAAAAATNVATQETTAATDVIAMPPHMHSQDRALGFPSRQYQPPHRSEFGQAGAPRNPPRYTKLSSLTFDDREDPLPWINRCKQFFRAQQTLTEDKVWSATYHLTVVAQLWYMRLERMEGTPNWRHFTDLVSR